MQALITCNDTLWPGAVASECTAHDGAVATCGRLEARSGPEILRKIKALDVYPACQVSTGPKGRLGEKVKDMKLGTSF